MYGLDVHCALCWIIGECSFNEHLFKYLPNKKFFKKINIYRINLEGSKMWLPNISFSLDFMDPKMKRS